MSKTRRCRWPPEEFNPHREQRAEPAADAWRIETPGRKRKRRRVAALQKDADSNYFTRSSRRCWVRLFVAQRGDRVYLDGAARGHPTGHQRDTDEQESDAG